MVFHSLACLSLVLGTLCSSVAALQISGSLLRQQVLNLDHEVSSRSARESAAHQLAPATKTTTRVLADSVHLCVQAAYNTTAAVQCPAGMMIESFQFASFGDPEASTSVACGHYRLGACHAVQTRAILQNFCTGQRICRVPVTNEFFGVPSHPGDGLDAHPVALRNGRDACRKAAESLAVEYRCVAAIGGSVEDRRYFDSLHEFYLGDDDEAGEQNMAGVSGTGSNALNGMSANAAGAGSAAAAAAAAAAADAAAAARLAAENELGAWKNEGWGTVHRCSWSGTPQPAQTWLTAGQMSDPAQPLFGRFRGRFMEDAGHLAAAGVLQALDVRDHSSHASQRPFNGTGEEERVRLGAPPHDRVSCLFLAIVLMNNCCVFVVRSISNISMHSFLRTASKTPNASMGCQALLQGLASRYRENCALVQLFLVVHCLLVHPFSSCALPNCWPTNTNVQLAL